MQQYQADAQRSAMDLTQGKQLTPWQLKALAIVAAMLCAAAEIGAAVRRQVFYNQPADKALADAEEKLHHLLHEARRANSAVLSLRDEQRDYERNSKTPAPSDALFLAPHQARLLHAALGMNDESGEMLQAALRVLQLHTAQDQNDIQALQENIVEEGGDALWWLTEALLACVPTPTGEELAQAAAANIAKLRVRYPAKYTDAHAAQRLDKQTAAAQAQAQQPLADAEYAHQVNAQARQAAEAKRPAPTAKPKKQR